MRHSGTYREVAESDFICKHPSPHSLDLGCWLDKYSPGFLLAAEIGLEIMALTDCESALGLREVIGLLWEVIGLRLWTLARHRTDIRRLRLRTRTPLQVQRSFRHTIFILYDNLVSSCLLVLGATAGVVREHRGSYIVGQPVSANDKPGTVNPCLVSLPGDYGSSPAYDVPPNERTG